jgi:hypothetical protein
MARYDVSATKTTAAAGLIGQLRNGSARDARVFEVGIFASTAVSGTVGLIRPSAVGATFTSTGPGAAHDPVVGAGVAVLDTAATTPPTIGSVYMRQIVLPATIGAGIIWTFPDGIVVPTSGSLALWQISAAAVTYAMYFSYDE